MKKCLAGFGTTLVTIVLILVFIGECYASFNTNVKVNIDGTAVVFPDQGPVIDVAAGRTLAPVSFIATNLGYKVVWDEATKKVTITQDKNTVVLTIGSMFPTINGAKAKIDCAPTIIGSRTMVPLAFIATAFGCTVKWDGSINMVYIITKGSTYVPPTSTVRNYPVGKTVDDLFEIYFYPECIGTDGPVITCYSNDNREYRWVCTSNTGLNTRHTFVYSDASPVTVKCDEYAQSYFNLYGKGYDTDLQAGMKITYDIYSGDNYVCTANFQLQYRMVIK